MMPGSGRFVEKVFSVLSPECIPNFNFIDKYTLFGNAEERIFFVGE